MAKKQTFKRLIPQTFSYHKSKLWEGLDYPLFRLNLNIVIKLIDDTKAELTTRFGGYSARQGIGGEIDSIEFVLQRLTTWNDEKADIDKREVYVYLEALNSHFRQLFEMFEELDAE